MTRIELEAITPTIGAVVRGVDLSRPLPEERAALLRSALLEHQVLFFPDQRLTPREHRDFAACFGPLFIHPIYEHLHEQPEVVVLDTNPDNPTDNDVWHTDATFMENPLAAVVLYPRVLPPGGGDTLWSSMTAAFSALSERMQDLLCGLHAVHDFARGFPPERYASAPGDVAKWRAARERYPPVVHPVIRTHPETEQKAVFVNEIFTTRIVELSPRESESILQLLFEHVGRPELVCRWRWSPDTAVVWDNRCTQHYAVNDYLPHRRVMHRIAVVGDRPV